MSSTRTVFQRCGVVPDARRAYARGARPHQRPGGPVELLYPCDILHHDPSDVGVGLPCHAGDGSGGPRACVEAARHPGAEPGIDHGANMTALMQGLPSGAALALAS